LRLISQNLIALDATQLRTSATLLAKEWIELVYNMRDSNLDKWLPRDCVLDSWFIIDPSNPVEPITACLRKFSLWNNKILQISFDSGDYMYALPVNRDTTFGDLRNTNKLYYITWDIWWHTIFRHSSRHQTNNTPTYFARYILFTGVREWIHTLPTDSILKVESHVLYTKWNKTWEVILESFVWNY
jgi:hypothetical protein